MGEFYSLRSLQVVHGLALLLLIAFTAAAGLVGLYLTNRSSDDAQRIGTILSLVEETRGDLHRQIKEVFDYHFLLDPKAADQYESFGRSIRANLDALNALAGDTEERAAINNLRERHQSVQRQLDRIMAKPAGTYDTADRLQVFDVELEGGSLNAIEQSLEAAHDLLSIAQKRIQSRLIRPDGIAFTILVMPIIAAAILFLVARTFMERALAKPLSSLLATMRAYGDGALDQRAPVGGAKEIVVLQRAINRMADELIDSREAQTKSEKQAALGALVPIMAHNIRNPLASIRATAQITDEPSLPSETRDALREIRNSVDRLEKWLGSLLAYLRPVDTRLVSGTLTACADDALDLLEQKRMGKQLDVERLSWEQSAQIWLDQALVEQAIYGLLANAMEAAPDSSRLELTAGHDAEITWIRIQDQGSGFTFDPSKNTDFPGPTTKTHGFGLGIPFAQKVCDLHGGSLIFPITKQKGACVEIRLPTKPPKRQVA